jgi:hypothetical protein
LRFDRKRFFDAYRLAFPGKLPVGLVRGLQELLSFIAADPAITDLRWAAYMLATVRHETADTYQPILERGPRSYFDKYEPGTKLGKRLGNKVKGDGYRRRGRGYVQHTGLANDEKMTKLLELPPEDSLVDHPEKALVPSIAYRIMSEGMRRGTFTGKKLADYIKPGEPPDYLNSRRIINGVDRAALIAGYAAAFEGVLLASVESAG